MAKRRRCRGQSSLDWAAERSQTFAARRHNVMTSAVLGRRQPLQRLTLVYSSDSTTSTMQSNTFHIHLNTPVPNEENHWQRTKPEFFLLSGFRPLFVCVKPELTFKLAINQRLKMFYQTYTVRMQSKRPKNAVFVSDDLCLWPWPSNSS